jgi:hypothetical protein
MAHALAMVDPHARPNQPTADPRLTAATVGDPAKSLLSRKSFEYNHSQSGTPSRAPHFGLPQLKSFYRFEHG